MRVTDEWAALDSLTEISATAVQDCESPEFVARIIQTYNLKWPTFDLGRQMLAENCAGVCSDETDPAVLGGVAFGDKQ